MFISSFEDIFSDTLVVIRNKFTFCVVLGNNVKLSRIHIYQTNICEQIWCVCQMGLLKICVTSTHGECEQTNRHTVIDAEQTSFDVCSIYRHPRECYRMQTKAFAIARSLLLYHPHIPTLEKQLCSFAVHSSFLWYMRMRLYK